MKRFDRKIITVVFCSAFALGGARLTSAHHSYAMFDVSMESEISGTVHELEWANPHIWLWVTAADAKGAQGLYAFEGTSVNEMARRSNWTKSTVSAGDKVTVSYRPFKDTAKLGGRIIYVKLPDGRTLDADTGLHIAAPPGGATPPRPDAPPSPPR